MSRFRRNEAGFTLIELLVSLALLAMLTIVLLEGFRFAMQPLHRQAARLEEASRVPVVYGFMRTHLSDAQPIVPVNGEVDAVAFDGRSDQVAFVAPAPQGAPRGGLYLFSVKMTSGQLHAYWQVFQGLLPVADRDADDTVLFDGVRRVDLAYYGKRWSDASVGWHNEWRQMPYLPLLIRCEFVLSNGEQLPALVVAPRLRPLRDIPVATMPPAISR